MKPNLQRYSEYKNSEIAWLGTVPAEWAIVRNKEIFKERSSLSTTGKETLLTVSHITGVTPRSEKNVNMFMAETMVGYKICHEGDLVINTMWAWMGALGTSNELGICSPSYNVYMPRKGVPYNHRYFDYLFRIPNSVMEMTRNSKGIVSSRLRLYAKDFFQIETVLPSLEEQEAIATYLDTKTAQIDRKIDLLTQKAQRYEELKRSLINETVTNGLDKSVPMKDSGIEWIGEIPEHWSLSRVKEQGSVRGRVGWKALKADEYVDEGYIFLSTPNIKGKEIDFENVNYITYERYVESPEIILKENDILLAKDGSTLGIVNIVNSLPRAATVNSSIAVVRLKKGTHEKYFYYQFLSDSIQVKINLKKIGMGVPHLFQRDINSFVLLLPPLNEQKAIAEYLDQKTEHIDRIIENINSQIEAQKELRKTLINNVVTGKIKVA